jgi:MFS family permease
VTTTFAPLRHRIFRQVWVASLVSTLGTLIQIVAAAWLMSSISDTANAVALVQAASNLPIMLFSVIAGAIADNFSRRKVMLVSQLFTLAASVGLAVLAYTSAVTPTLLLLFIFLIGCGTALQKPSWFASVGDMVPKDSLPMAVSLNSIQNNMGRTLGPTFGGAIVATVGAAAAFAISAVSQLGLIFVLLRWKPPVAENTIPREEIRTAIIAGLRYVSMSPDVWKILVRGAAFGFCSVSLMALLPLVARDILGGDAFLYGTLFSGFGAGAILGALSTAFVRRKLSSEWNARVAVIASGIAAVITAFSPYAPLTFAALMFAGAWWVLGFTLFNVTVQVSTPRWIVGRALSLYHTCTFGGMALGSWVWGMTADAYGTSSALLISGLATAAGALLGFGRLRLLAGPPPNLDLLNRWAEPELKLDPLSEGGIVHIQVEYVIAPEDTRAFLDLMLERKRIRRRNSALRWTLAQDLEQPDRWVESYQFPRWVDYVRYAKRTTHADDVVREAIHRLHRGVASPFVRRTVERRTGVFRGPHPSELADPNS